jgi:hypothetical protein
MLQSVTEAEEAAAEEEFWGEGGVRSQMDEQVEAHIAANRCQAKLNGDLTEYKDLVSYSAYPYQGQDDAYQNNLLDVAVEGRVKFISKTTFEGNRPWHRRGNYESEVLENPTWLDICLCANDMINATGDHHHIFLEDVYKTGSFTLDDKSFILIYDFSMGS